MYLKQIEIQGFKTFADRTHIVFTPGITCVIGPNGSGKSNIADAILWVLGENNVRSLRGNTAQDIIFAGNDRRRPLGMAEVALTIDNSGGILPLEFSEITVTRRVYRSGESEYFINKVACRLRDIYELFLDTGVGRDAYAMINQGQIDQILSVRAEDRRAIFEEAAGIKKYRVRKREAERKLENTRQNLLRVTDILAEIEGRLGPLQRQAAAAGKYRDLAGRLRVLETAWYGQRIRRLRTERQGLAELVAALKDERARLEADLKAAQDGESGIRDELRQIEERTEVERKAETDALQRVAGAEAERVRAEERAGEVQRRLKAIEAELEDLARRTEEQVRRSEQNTTEAAAGQGAVEELRSAVLLAQKHAAAGAAAHEEAARRLEQRRQAWVARERRQAELAARSEAQAQRALALEVESQGAAHALAEAEQELARMEGEHDALREQLAALSERATGLRAESEAGRSAVAAAETAQQQARRAAEAAGQALQAHRARLQALQDLGDRGEGAAAGARRLLAAARGGGVPGEWSLLVDLLGVPEGLDRAVEAALGPYADALLCASPEVAAAGLAWARAQNAAVLVLPGAPVAAEAHPDSLAARVSAASEPARAWVESLLGRAVLVGSLGERPGTLQVTEAGEWEAASGALSSRAAGGEGSAAALLARQRELGALREVLPAREAAAASARQDRDLAEATLREAQATLREAQAAGERARLEHQGALRESERRNGDRERARHRGERQRQHAERVESERAALGEARRRVADELQVAAESDAGLEPSAPLAAAQDAVTAAEAERRRAESALADLRVRAAEQEQRWQGMQEAVRRSQEAGAFLDRQRTDRLREQRTLTAERDQRRLAFGSLGQEVDQAQATATAAREAQAGLAEARQGLSARLASGRAEAVVLGGRLRELMERCHRAEVELAAVDAQLKHTGQQWIDATVSAHMIEAIEHEDADEPFSLTVDGLMSSWDPMQAEVVLTSCSDPEGEIGRLRRQIRALGAINPDAPEQYAESRERYDFLASQKADLESAREQLEEAIREIDAASRDTFLAAFHQIATAFDETFRHLFGGGATELRLTDPTDVLETGIDIIVQPPGKKQQNLLLLSGGERALTAAAMLFALLRVRPSPFCVLDEVDAPLDESNVGRFARMLRDFTAKTQFIVVTHNRGTMEEADTLYGVTMEERGISKVLSCTLADPVVAQVEAESAAAVG